MNVFFKALSFVLILTFCSFSLSASSFDKVDQALRLRLTKPSVIYQSKGVIASTKFTISKDVDLRLENDETVKWYNTRAARISYAPVAFFCFRGSELAIIVKM